MPSDTATAAVVNDFAVTVATANGTGSQTANNALIRALFLMGIPVNGKNLFPSNIQGLPTWFTIRVNRDGHVGRPDHPEILVAFNRATLVRDVEELPPGGVCVHPDDLKPPARDDVTVYALPVKDLVKASGAASKFRSYIANMAYVGALVELLGIERSEIRAALDHHFGDKAKIVEQNLGVIDAASAWVRENIEKRDPFRVERMNGTDGLILIDGNAAAALGALCGGVTVASWYPITPSSSVIESLVHYAGHLRDDPDTGESTLAVVQAEDELGALGMVVGAGWAGARAMTATSGPGLSLMAEMSGLAWFAEVPAVVWDIQRVGPSTGLPTRTSQGDLLSAHLLSHGETRHPVLLPGSVGECFEFGHVAFDLAERLQTPVFVLSDLDLGMNLWMSPPFEYPDRPIDRGKVLSAEEVEAGWGRYRDVDGDGVCARTLPGNENPLAAWFARGTGHDEAAVYSERPDDWTANMARLRRKIETARSLAPAPVVDETEGASIGIVSFGSSEHAIHEARGRLAAEGIATSHLRVRALPLSDEVGKFLARHERVHVIELNADAQLYRLLREELGGAADHAEATNLGDGLPLTAGWVADAIRAREEER